MGGGELALGAANRLLDAIDLAPMATDDKEAWKRSAHQRLEEALALVERERELKRAFLRFRTLSATLFAALGLAAITLARPSLRYGKSSSPVS